MMKHLFTFVLAGFLMTFAGCDFNNWGSWCGCNSTSAISTDDTADTTTDTVDSDSSSESSDSNSDS